MFFCVSGMAVTDYVQLDWWPITRDCILYALSVFILICFTWDGKITLVESTGNNEFDYLFVSIVSYTLTFTQLTFYKT